MVGLALAALVALIGHLASIGRDAGWGALVVAAIATVVLELVAIAVCRVKDVAGSFTFALAIGLLATMAAAPAIRFAHHDKAERVTSTVVLVAVVFATVGLFKFAVWWFGRRGEIVDGALRTGMYGGQTLVQLKDRPVYHVFCSTNLGSGTQAYLTPRLVSGHLMGTGETATDLLLSTAVQCSATFPGGFNPRRLGPSDLFNVPAGVQEVDPPQSADLVDGGMYDNMGDKWEIGWDSRVRRLAKIGGDLSRYNAKPSTVLIVVNAGGQYDARLLEGYGLRRELGALMKDKSVMYDQTTAVKRRYLYQAFIAGKPLKGAIVQIGQSPYDVLTDIAGNTRAPQEMRDRAEQALTVLRALGQPRAGAETVEKGWIAVADDNASVPTVLSPIAQQTAVDLIFHAYVLTRVNTFVLLGQGDFPAGDDPDVTSWARDQFAKYVSTALGS